MWLAVTFKFTFACSVQLQRGTSNKSFAENKVRKNLKFVRQFDSPRTQSRPRTSINSFARAFQRRDAFVCARANSFGALVKLKH